MNKEAKVIQLQTHPDGVAAGLRTYLRPGRFEVATAGLDPQLQLVGGDPWGTPDFMGLIVPAAATPAFANRYLFLLARAQFNNGERARLVGIRQYASIVTTFTDGSSPPKSQILEQEITSPAFRFPDGNISWHVMLMNKTWRDTRNAATADSLVFEDAFSPALLFQALAPYVPPNGGRPWGVPIGASGLGNIHDMRYPWRNSRSERALDVPIPGPCDVALFASVAQTAPANQPAFTSLSASEQDALAPDWAFYTAFQANGVTYGRVAGALVFEEEEWTSSDRGEHR